MKQTTDQVVNILMEAGGYLTNDHFILKSKKHSREYLHCRLALMDQEYRAKLASLVLQKFSDTKIDAVAGFSVGGILLAKGIAKQRQCQLIVGKESGNDILFETQKIQLAEKS